MSIPRFAGALLAVLSAVSLPLKAQVPPPQSAGVVGKASRAFEEKKYDETLQLLQEADKITPNDPFVLNFMGAVYCKKKDYATALPWFEKSLAANPDYFPARFNIGEVSFLEKKYAEALGYFSQMLEKDPKNSLLLFKCFLCQILLDQTDDAAKTLKRIKYPGDSPAWYYAQAAWEIKHGRRNKADDLIAAAKYVYNKQGDLYNETLQDCELIR